MIDIDYFTDKTIKFSTNESKYWFIQNCERITNLRILDGYKNLKKENVDMRYPYCLCEWGYFSFRAEPMENLSKVEFEVSSLYIYFKPDSSFSSFLEYKLSISENKTEILSKLKETNPQLIEREKIK